MTYKIYHNPRCSKSRQTLALMRENGVEPEIVEYLKDVPTAQELSDILQQLKLDAVDILRKGEAIFKDNYKGKDLSNSEWIDVMVANPKLIERPIVVKGKKAILGRPPEKVLDLI